MPVNYGLLRGRVIDFLPYNGGSDHFQIEVQANDEIYRIAVDVYSVLGGHHKHFATDGIATFDHDRLVMYYKDENYQHPVLEQLLQVSVGLTAREDLPDELCLDYIRSQNLFPVGSMRVVQPKDLKKNQGEDLNDDIGPSVTGAKQDASAEVFAFGSSWDDDAAGARPDTHPYFKPNPSKGIHDIHMNQGDTGNEARYNGTHQDGALLFHFPNEARWVAMFFRFQNQSLQTDDDGNPQ